MASCNGKPECLMPAFNDLLGGAGATALTNLVAGALWVVMLLVAAYCILLIFVGLAKGSRDLLSALGVLYHAAFLLVLVAFLVGN